MFKRRRKSPFKVIGSIILIAGIVMFLYVIPLKIWYFIIACLFILIGLLLVKT